MYQDAAPESGGGVFEGSSNGAAKLYQKMYGQSASVLGSTDLTSTVEDIAYWFSDSGQGGQLAKEVNEFNPLALFLNGVSGLARGTEVDGTPISGADAGYKLATAPLFAVGRTSGILKGTTRFFNAARGSRVFWSGGDIAKNSAMNFAKANGMKTLEMTTSRRIMNTVNPYLPRSISSPIWDGLSRYFARGATGNINVFQNAAGVSLRSTWRRIEYPILQNNNIIFHTVK